MSADQAAALFEATYSRPADGVWEAPGRVNLIGEHTDYNGGLVLPIALPERTWCAAARRDDGRLALVSDALNERPQVALTDIAPGNPSGWGKYPAGVLWALTDAGYEVAGLDAAFVSAVPVGSGLSSSAAIEGSIAAAASDLFGLGLLDSDDGRTTLATVCQRAENVIAQAPTGGMDQAASLRSRAGNALLLDCRSGEVEHVPFDLAAHGLSLLVIDTRASHSHATGQYGERRASCEQAAAELGVETLREVDPADLASALDQLSSDLLRKRAKHVVTEIERVRQAVAALRADDFDRLGELFVASHVSLRDDFEVSCPELDTAVDASLSAGALGARMTGGGFGGSAIALVREDAVGATILAVEKAFTDAGFTAPACFPAVAGEPARRSA